MVWLFACVETGLKPIDDADPADSPSSSDPPVAHPPLLQADPCDGVDNDGDGVVDEGASDADADGVADCLDDACAAETAEAGIGSFVSACGPGTTKGGSPAEAVPLWVADGEGMEVISCLFVAAGDLDNDANPEVVCSGLSGGSPIVLDGATGNVLRRLEELGERSRVVLADLEPDGDIDIIGFDNDGYVRAVDPGGALLWVSDEPLWHQRQTDSTPLLVADVEGDGRPEVVVPRAIVDGTTGAVRTPLDYDEETYAAGSREMAVEDLDRDGFAEVVTPWWCRAHDGTLLWELTPAADWWGTVTMLVVQADEDDEGEIVFVGEVEYLLVDADGTELSRLRLADGQPSATQVQLGCAGELDGTPGSEVVVPSQYLVTSYEPDGTKRWELSAYDYSTSSACSTFDFDLDGIDEVLVFDENGFRVLAGPDGATLFEDLSFPSGTGIDAAVILDLDGDDSPEILVSGWQADDWPGSSPLRVYTNPARDWPSVGPLWQGEAWSGTSLQSDGTVPRTPPAPWLEYGHWRSQPEGVVLGADLALDLLDTCATRCDGGTVTLSLQLRNAGPEEAPDGVPVAVYGLDDTGARTLLSVTRPVPWIDDDHSSSSFEVQVTGDQARHGIELVAWDEGAGVSARDCDPENNVLVWAWGGC